MVKRKAQTTLDRDDIKSSQSDQEEQKDDLNNKQTQNEKELTERK
jgi:hypothetical protein